MSPLNTIAGVRISLASPALIRAWSSGEVTRPNTINYLTNKPEPGGLFCERIFGPMHDWRCACGTSHRSSRVGGTCSKCGVPIASSRVRRERMGHIELAAPVVHPWFAHGNASVLSLLLDLTPRQLRTVLAMSGSLITSIAEEERARAVSQLKQQKEAAQERKLLARLRPGSFLSEKHTHQLLPRYGHCFQIQTGAQAIREVLAALDLAELAASLRRCLQQETDQRKLLARRLRLVEALRTSGIDPTWMVLDVLPVLPPDLRPLVHVGGGRFATSDLNTLYERVIHRNQRVRRFIELGAPVRMLHYEQRLLQEACDALFDHTHAVHPRVGSQRRPLKSLTDLLGGKQGRFRRNLLGKRVDYSGRSVICVGLDLRLHECGLPKKMALELFKPFVIRKLVDRHLARSVRHAKHLVERRDALVWDQLAECLHEKVVLLNRAPTLHRLSIQAFEAKLVEGDAIRLHPLVCSAFNADFDGDQMAVHLPLSDEAQMEARRLLLSVRNLRSPATGEPSISLTQEIVLGCYYLTEDRPASKHVTRAFLDVNEAQRAYEQGIIGLHTSILVRVPDRQQFEAPPPSTPVPITRGRIETTVGRLLFNQELPAALRYRNYPMNKERVKQLLAESLDLLGEDATARLADALKQLGYRFATTSGLSFAMSDIEEPPEKQALVRQGQEDAQAIQQEFHEGTITAEERDQRTIALWSQVTEQVSQCLLERLDPWGTISTIVKSGATKAKFQQIRQLSGIRGLMASPSGRIIPIPVLGNYRAGLHTWEVFIAGSGARKGFMDRSLNTAQSGYLTRKLVEVGMEVWTTCQDCGTSEGWLITNDMQGGTELRARIVGRVLAEAVGNLPAGTLLSEKQADQLLETGITALRVRSPFTCQADYGICCQCYGRDLATGQLVKQGVAVGIMAGQSIGEPGTQLTMRTFHSGGIANAQGDITQGLPRVNELFEARIPQQPAVLAEIEGRIQLEKHEHTGRITMHVIGDDQQKRVYHLAVGQAAIVEPGQHVEIGVPLTVGACDPKQLLKLQGREATARYLVHEIQRVYRATGVYINDKHVEAIVRQMLRYVQVIDAGDTELLPGDLVDRFTMLSTNAQVQAQGGQPAIASPVLLGLTRAALQTSSWIAAASFQQTSRVLTQAALRGLVDPLRGWKERVVIGQRLPTGL